MFKNFIVLGTVASPDEIPPLVSGDGGTYPGVKPEIDMIEQIIYVADDVIELVLSILDFMVNNPVLLFLLAFGFVSVGIGVFKMLKKKI